MNRPKVSIIVPIYNVAAYLQRCMDSLLNQTLRDIEIILVDDGSPDNCPQMCDEYAKQDNRIKVIHKKNEGLGYARNTGLEATCGEFIAFIDSDDYVDVSMYETLYNRAIENQSDAVFCGMQRRCKDGTVFPRRDVEQETNFQGEDFMFVMDLNPEGVCFDNEPLTVGKKVTVVKGEFSGIEGEIATEANKTYVVIRITGVLVASIKVPKSYLKAIND